MKMTGQEWKEFEQHGWPEGYIWSDESKLEDGREFYLENGNICISDDEVFVVPDFWGMFYEGPDGSQIDGGDGFAMRSVIRKWRRARDTKTLVINVPRDRVDAIKGLLREQKIQIS